MDGRSSGTPILYGEGSTYCLTAISIFCYPTKMDIVDRIVQKKISDGKKLLKLYAVVMLNYREPLGDRAWDAIGALFKDPSSAQGFAFLTGLLLGGASNETLHGLTDKFKEFLEEEL